MEDYLVWKILGVDENADEDALKKAYRSKLATVNPEDDQEGFMRLREAYEQALEMLARKNREEAEEISEDEELLALKNGDAYDQFMYEIHMIYKDFNRRVDTKEWEKAFDFDICATAEIDDTIPERLLVFIMDHYYMPTAVWKCMDDKFHYVENLDDWKDRFPENYLGFVRYKMTQGEFIDFDYLSGDLSQNVDDFLRKYLDLKDVVDHVGDTPIESFEQLYKEIKLFDIEYPPVEVEYLRYLYEMDKKENGEVSEETIELAKELCDEYGDMAYIEFYCAMVFEDTAEIDLAEDIYKHLLEENPSHYRANVGIACILEKRGEYKEAKEIILDLLEKDESIAELHEICNRINNKLVEDLKAKIEANEERGKNAMELAWSYFQLRDFEKTEEALTMLPEEEYDAYDHVNLTGRNYLAMDRFEEALPYLLDWQSQIIDTVDDGTKENRRKINRISFSYFAIGLCQWHIADRDEAVNNIKKGIELEKSFFIKLSFMDELARLYIETEEWEKAVQVCDSIIDFDKSYYPAYLKRQECYFELKNGQGVIDDFFECTRIYPGYVKPYVLAMKVFFYYEEYEDVKHVYENAKEHNLESDEMELFYIKALGMLEEGEDKLKEHLEMIDNLKGIFYKKKQENQETDLKEEDLIVENAFIYWDLKECDKAIDVCEKGLENLPDSVRIIKTIGDFYLEQKKYGLARLQFEKYIEKDQDNRLVYLGLGKCHWHMSNYDAAIHHFEKSYELYQDSDEVLWYLARAHSERYKSKNNYDDYEKAIKFASMRIDRRESSYNYNERGIIREGANDFQGALADYLKAIELEPDNVYAMNNVADMFRMLRMDDEAFEHLEKCLDLNYADEGVWIFSNWSKLHEHRGEYEKACEYTLKQLELNKDSSSLLRQLARQYTSAKKYEEAIETYKKMHELEYISESEMVYKMAGCYNGMDNRLKTKMLLMKAVEIAEETVKNKDSESNWEEVVDAYDAYAEFQKNTLEDFPTAIKYYEKCLEIAKEHAPDKVTYANEVLAEICYEIGELDKAKKYANGYIDSLCKEDGSVEAYLNDRRYLRVRAVDISCCYLILGEMELAKKYLKLASEGNLCCHCHHKDCFEGMFMVGLFKEIDGDIEGAIEFYKKSLEISDDYERAIRALRRLGVKN